MLSLIADHFKSSWLVCAAFILSLCSICAYGAIRVNLLERQINNLQQNYAQCESAILVQNDAVLKMQQANDAAKQRQIDVDKVAAMFRADQYKSIDQIKAMKWPGGCDDAAALGIDLMTR